MPISPPSRRQWLAALAAGFASAALRMKHLLAAHLAVLVLPGLAPGHASAQATDHDAHHASAPATSGDSAPALSEGEVTRWDARTGKITLRHGELKNLGMPPMTMVFTLREPAQAGQIKGGDKVRFRAEQVNGAYVVTHIEPAR